MRASVLPLGGRQSVARIGSHTTSTRSFRSGYRTIHSSVAEAPADRSIKWEKAATPREEHWYRPRT
jgi:hypothetical protein